MPSQLSVLITYHNERDLLRAALESVLTQQGAPDEVLVYDDASECPAEHYLPSGWPVRLIRGTVNRGLGFARNQLLNASNCEYVHFHDADDLFHPTWCQRVRAAIENPGADIILTEIQSFSERGVLCSAVLGLVNLHNTDLVRFALRGPILAPATTFRRKLGLKINGFRTREELPLSEDGDFHIRLGATGGTYYTILEPLVLQRVRPDSLSRSRGASRLECWTSGLIMLHHLSEELGAQYRPDLAEAAAWLGGILFRQGDRANARAAFGLASKLGGASYCRQTPFYRAVARVVGAETAERLGGIYRRALPNKIRALLRGS